MAMSPSEALRRVEGAMMPLRTPAGVTDAWEAYRKEWLTGGAEEDGAIGQGFDAGYRAAMAAVARELGRVQSEVLREPREPAPLMTEYPAR